MAKADQAKVTFAVNLTPSNRRTCDLHHTKIKRFLRQHSAVQTRTSGWQKVYLLNANDQRELRAGSFDDLVCADQ
jgi:hypothetical protein